MEFGRFERSVREELAVIDSVFPQKIPFPSETPDQRILHSRWGFLRVFTIKSAARIRVNSPV
jgi:hypothetical protein